MYKYLSMIQSNFKHKKRMYLLEFCMIAVVTIAMQGVLLVCFSFVNANEKNSGYFGKQHVTFMGNIPKFNQEELEEYGIDVVSRYNISEKVFDNGYETISIKMKSMENIKGVFKDIIVEGEYPDNDNEMLVPGYLKYSTKTIWKVGDKVRITDEAGKTKDVVICGFYEYISQDTSFMDEVFSLESEKSDFHYCDVIFRNNLNIKSKTSKFAEAYSLNYSINEMRLSVFESEDSVVLVLYLILAIVFLIICYSMIRSVIALRAPQTDKENAIIRSFGGSRKQIYRYETLEISLMAVIASIVGTFVTIGIFYSVVVLADLSLKTIKEILSNNLLHSTIISVFIVWLLSLVAALCQTKKSLKRTISETLSNNENYIIKNIKRTHRFNNPVIAYIMTSLSRNIRKTILCSVLFSISIILYIFISMFDRDIRKLYGADDRLDQSYDIRLSLVPSWFKTGSVDDVLIHIKMMNEVEKARLYPIIIDRFDNVDDGFRCTEVKNIYTTIDGKYEKILIALYSDDELKNLLPAIKEGNTNIKDGGCILVNYAYPVITGSNFDFSQKTKISNLGVGDHLKTIDIFTLNRSILKKIQLGSYDDKDVLEYIKRTSTERNFLSLQINGIAENDLYGQSMWCPVVIISDEYYKSNIAIDNSWGGAIDISLKDGVKLGDIVDELKRLGCFESINYINPAHKNMEANELILGLFFVIVIMAALIGVIIVMCTIMIDWEISRKEYAILKSVGATTGRVRLVILAEKSFICIVSYLLGVSLGIIIERVLLTIAMKGTGIPLILPIKDIFLVFIIMVVLITIATAIQSYALKRMTISEVMNKSL